MNICSNPKGTSGHHPSTLVLTYGPMSQNREDQESCPVPASEDSLPDLPLPITVLEGKKTTIPSLPTRSALTLCSLAPSSSTSDSSPYGPGEVLGHGQPFVTRVNGKKEAGSSARERRAAPLGPLI